MLHTKKKKEKTSTTEQIQIISDLLITNLIKKYCLITFHGKIKKQQRSYNQAGEWIKS